MFCVNVPPTATSDAVPADFATTVALPSVVLSTAATDGLLDVHSIWRLPARSALFCCASARYVFRSCADTESAMLATCGGVLVVVSSAE